jgi:DeoR family transcriptional regulator, aga operon transcriptional repressor
MSDEGGRFAYASAVQRRDRLAQFVTEQGYCTIQELSQRFGVSEMTIRRDVARLVAESRLRAFHGGVGSLSPSDLNGVNYSDRDKRMSDAKHAIALRALERVAPGTAIGIDAGTTAAQLAGLLPGDLGLQVVTPSLPAVNTLAGNPGVELTALGGVFHTESLSFAGPATLAAIANLHLDVLFLAASGLSDRGAFCGNSFDAVTKRALIDVAGHVILLADSSKFSSSSMARICGWDAIDSMIVDTGLTPEDQAMVEGFGVSVDLVAVDRPVKQSASVPL